MIGGGGVVELIKTKKFLGALSGIITALVVIGGAIVWALNSTFPTKEEAEKSIVIGIEGHNSNINAHKELIREWLIPMVVEEVEKRHHDRRRSELSEDEQVEVMVMGHDG